MRVFFSEQASSMLNGHLFWSRETDNIFSTKSVTSLFKPRNGESKSSNVAILETTSLSIPMDAIFLTMLPVSEIAIVKVIKTPFAGSFGNASAVAIYTIQPEEEEDEEH